VSTPPVEAEQPGPAPLGAAVQPAPAVQASERRATEQRRVKRATRARDRTRPASRRRERPDSAAPEPRPQPNELLRIESLVPDVAVADDSSPRMLLLAAGALLALVMASGSLLSVAARVIRGELW
jgi:hypothetical protein